MQRKKSQRRTTRRVIAGATVAAGMLAVVAPAQAATTATFDAGVLTVTGDALDDNTTISRNAAGAILVNGGAVSIIDGTATVANTTVEDLGEISSEDHGAGASL
jgi:hypothetical protein